MREEVVMEILAENVDFEDAAGADVTEEDRRDFRDWLRRVRGHRIRVGYYKRYPADPDLWVGEGRHISDESLIYVFAG